MSIRQGSNIIAGGDSYHPDLFDWKWADHICNDVQWLRADTFSWQAGSVYESAYQHLADDIDGKTLQSETIGSTTIQFYLADDGHKICPASEESNVTAIYNATGVAWYYIIDTTNERFKLPRTKFGVTGLRDTVGKYVEPTVPNITGTFRATLNTAFDADDTGAFTRGPNLGAQVTSLKDSYTYRNYEHTLNASDSSDAYQNGATVQPPATQMYLYFYVGEFTQTALENTAGLNAELFNGKVDVGHQVIALQAPTAQNNYTWYRKYADGWVEQGGLATIPSRTNVGDSSTTVTFPIPMSDTNYTGQISYQNGGNYFASCTLTFNNRQTTGVNLDFYMNESGTTDAFLVGWEVKGMAA